MPLSSYVRLTTAALLTSWLPLAGCKPASAPAPIAATAPAPPLPLATPQSAPAALPAPPTGPRLATPMPPAAPPATAGAAPANSDLQNARLAGWQSASLVLDSLKAGDNSQFPGIAAWLEDVQVATSGIDANIAVDQWPAVDIDALVTNNPNFWHAHYEIAPGDPAMHLLHAGLLLTGSEASRTSALVNIALERPGLPDELRQGLLSLGAHSQKAQEASNALIQQGIALYDAGDHAGALARHDAAIAQLPQNGFAHYERGLTLLALQLAKAGQKPLPLKTLKINDGPKFSAEVQAAYAAARHHDPFQINAWQGDDQQVIAGFLAMAKQGMPAWQQVQKSEEPVDNEVLESLADALQVAGTHDLALVTRQILVARRGSYAPADHPFITKSMQAIAPGDTTSAVLKRLWEGPLVARQIVNAPIEMVFQPETKTPPTNEAFDLKQLRFYVPIPNLEERLGPDVQPLADYVKALELKAAAIVAEHDSLPAKGLLIAVGIKSKTKTRIWCQAVEGELPAELLTRLEMELGAVEAFDLLKAPAALGLEIGLFGQAPKQFPEFPDTWLEEAKRTETALLIPPDELFKTLWPD